MKRKISIWRLITLIFLGIFFLLTLIVGIYINVSAFNINTPGGFVEALAIGMTMGILVGLATIFYIVSFITFIIFLILLIITIKKVKNG